MSGALDDEDKRIEAVTMEAHAISKGFQRKILFESRSSSTLKKPDIFAPYFSGCWRQERNHYFRTVSYVAS
jgi:hypothetical protein